MARKFKLSVWANKYCSQKMKKNLRVFGLLITVLLAGIYIGYYVTAVRYEYIRATGAGNEALSTLDLLEKDLIEKVVDIQQGNIVASFAMVDGLPRWAKIFNPSNEDHPRPKDKIEFYHAQLDALDGHFAMKVFGLSREDLKRILKTHFSHYEVLRTSQDFIDDINERIGEDHDTTTESSEPDAAGQRR